MKMCVECKVWPVPEDEEVCEGCCEYQWPDDLETGLVAGGALPDAEF